MYGVAGDAEMSFQMHSHHRIPIRLSHRGKHTVAVDAGVVDYGMQSTKVIDSLLYGIEAVVIVGDVGGINNGFATGADYARNNFCSSCFVDVVNDYAGAFLGQHFGVGRAEPAACTGDYYYSVFT